MSDRPGYQRPRTTVALPSSVGMGSWEKTQKQGRLGTSLGFLLSSKDHPQAQEERTVRGAICPSCLPWLRVCVVTLVSSSSCPVIEGMWPGDLGAALAQTLPDVSCFWVCSTPVGNFERNRAKRYVISQDLSSAKTPRSRAGHLLEPGVCGA